MKIIRRPILCMIAMAIVTLLITSTSIVSIKDANPQENNSVAEYVVAQCQPLKTKTIEKPLQTLSSAGKRITDGDYNEYHPSIARGSEGDFYAMVTESTDGSIWRPTLYNSADGVTWNKILTIPYDYSGYTDMDQNDYETYGTFDTLSGEIVVVHGEIAVGWSWNFSASGFNNFSNNRIDCYTFKGPDGDPGTWNWGGLAFTGDNYYVSPPISGCPFIFYQCSADGNGILSWLSGNVSGCKHVSSAMDLVTNMHYTVYDRDPGNGTYELLVRKVNFGIWDYVIPGFWKHPYMWSKHVTNSNGLTYPSVAAYNDNIIIACQKGNDVNVYYSNDGFSTYSSVLVQTSASYPEVVISQGRGFITYIKNNVLYYRTSDTGGFTWSDEQVVSDNQVNLNYRAANLDENNGNVLCTWEDTRGANIDAYFDVIYGTINYPPVCGTPNPANASTGNPIKFNWSIPIIDPEGDLLSWTIQCSNGQNNSGTSDPNGNKSLALSGLTYSRMYKVWVNATDPRGSDLHTRKVYTFYTGANQPPNPPTIDGPTSGKQGQSYNYTFNSIDPNQDDLYYFIDWGDQTNSSWIGPYLSGNDVIKSHRWSKGTYVIIVQAKDINGLESNWSTLQVTMPFSYEPPHLRFFEWLFERFPHAFPIIRHLLGY
jgi:hypothetical protein